MGFKAVGFDSTSYEKWSETSNCSIVQHFLLDRELGFYFH